MVVGTLTTSSTGLPRAAPILFIFGWHSFQPFFHKPWLTESSGACQQSHTMKECLLFLFYYVDTPPHLCFLKPWLTESFGCRPTITNHGGVSILINYFGTRNPVASSYCKVIG